MTSCKKSGPTQQMLNIIKNLDRKVFRPYLITMYHEEENSQLPKYLPYIEHHFVPTSKVDAVFGRTKALKTKLKELSPDIIHVHGLFPGLAICGIKEYPKITTLRGYVDEDYPTKYGKIRGGIMVKLQFYALKRMTKVVTCSQSLSSMYKTRMGLSFDYIQNGVDVDAYNKVDDTKKALLREKFQIPQDSFVYVYTGQLIERKNMDFLLSVFNHTFKSNDVYILILGGGSLYGGLVEKYGSVSNIDFRGSVDNIPEYLNASDAYVSCSKSEGLPNGVLEAMAAGLPVVLSDIVQHKEIFSADTQIGFLFDINSEKDLSEKLVMLYSQGTNGFGKEAYKTAHNHFSALVMSKKYQDLYVSIICKERN